MNKRPQLPASAERILILGSSGSGKSVLARAMGQALGLPVVHLDRLFWQPGWVSAEPQVFDQQVQQLAAEPRWIIEGNYRRTVPPRLARAEAVIYLDLPRWLCVWRVLRRHGTKRPDLNPALQETRDWELVKFLWDTWRFPATRGRDVLQQLQGSGVPLLRLTARRQVEALVHSLEHP